MKRHIGIMLILSLSLHQLVTAQNTVGLIQSTDESSPGYTLFTPNKSHSTYLIDNEGRLIREWVSDYLPTLSVYLLENGDLLRSAALTSDDSPRTGGFQLFNWEGDLLWEYYCGPQHHDIEPLPNGNVLVIKNDQKTSDTALSAGRDPALIDGPSIRSTSIFEVQQAGPDSGTVVWEWNAWDHLIQNFDSTKTNFGVVSDHPELMDINFARDGGASWLHTNGIDYNPGLDQIVLSNRAINELWIIDHSTTMDEAASHSGGNSGLGGDLLYRWGNPVGYGAGDTTDQQLFSQHDARWVLEGYPGAGNLTVFSNGEDRPTGEYATVEELILPIDSLGAYLLLPGEAYAPSAPFWTYAAEVELNFQASRYGGAHRLPNGNTLICSPLEGKIFEVTPELGLVWEYINPVSENGILYQGDIPELNTMFRGERYATDYSGFYGRDLTPGDPIEQYSNGVGNLVQTPDASYLADAFPNPFNPSTTLRFHLRESSHVTLRVYDIRGDLIRELITGQMIPGVHQLAWDGRDNNGLAAPSGVYVYRLESARFTQAKRMVLIR